MAPEQSEEKPPYELWDAGGKYSYLYTENHELAKYLGEHFKPAYYEREGKVFGWQFRIKTDKVPFFVSRGKPDPVGIESAPLTNQGVTRPKYCKDAPREANKGEVGMGEGVREVRP
jgi:hypothetical protein